MFHNFIFNASTADVGPGVGN